MVPIKQFVKCALVNSTTLNCHTEQVVLLDEYAVRIAQLEDSIEMTFTHPHSKQKCKITHIQVPIALAFAMTAYKAQGQTLTKAIVDPESCRGTESLYVMIFHVKSLNGLLILHKLSKNRITSQLEDTQ